MSIIPFCSSHPLLSRLAMDDGLTIIYSINDDPSGVKPIINGPALKKARG
jgi:hypothetical protein